MSSLATNASALGICSVWFLLLKTCLLTAGTVTNVAKRIHQRDVSCKAVHNLSRQVLSIVISIIQVCSMCTFSHWQPKKISLYILFTNVHFFHQTKFY